MNVRNFFLEHTNYSENDIVSISKPVKGWHNATYFVKTEDNEYAIREVDGGLHGKENKIDHHDEIVSLKLMHLPFVYLDEKTGDFIKIKFEGETYQTGKTPVDIIKKVINEKVCFNVGAELKKIHTININEHLKDFTGTQFHFEPKKEHIGRVSNEVNNLFFKLMRKYNESNKVLSHNDLFLPNIVINKETNKIEIIDYEHCRPNSEFWDIMFFLDDIGALFEGQRDNLRKSFFKGYELKKEEEFDEITKYELSFMNNVGGYLWMSEQMLEDKESTEWLNTAKKRVDETYSWLSKNTFI